MNWMAWNSVWANALRNSPRAIPSSALATATTTANHSGPVMSSPRAATPTTMTIAVCTHATRAKLPAYPNSRPSRVAGSAISRSRVPERRSRSMAIEATRNIDTSGKTPMSGNPTRWNTSGRESKAYLTRVSNTLGTARRSASVR